MYINNYSNYIILLNYCEEEITLSHSQLCCNNNCNTSVNYDSILLFFQQLILASDTFYVFSLRILDTLCWHIEQLNIEQSIDALPQGKKEDLNYNCEHQKLLNFQFQVMFITYQLLLTSQG